MENNRFCGNSLKYAKQHELLVHLLSGCENDLLLKTISAGFSEDLTCFIVIRELIENSLGVMYTRQLGNGSLRDIIHETQPDLPYHKKYGTVDRSSGTTIASVGNPLRLPMIRDYAAQIMDACIYLQSIRFPYFNLHTGNVIIKETTMEMTENKRIRTSKVQITDYENAFLGFENRLKKTIQKIPCEPLLGSFICVLYEMATGRELSFDSDGTIDLQYLSSDYSDIGDMIELVENGTVKSLLELAGHRFFWLEGPLPIQPKEIEVAYEEDVRELLMEPIYKAFEQDRVKEFNKPKESRLFSFGSQHHTQNDWLSTGIGSHTHTHPQSARSNKAIDEFDHTTHEIKHDDDDDDDGKSQESNYVGPLITDTEANKKKKAPRIDSESSSFSFSKWFSFSSDRADHRHDSDTDSDSDNDNNREEEEKTSSSHKKKKKTKDGDATKKSKHVDQELDSRMDQEEESTQVMDDTKTRPSSSSSSSSKKKKGVRFNNHADDVRYFVKDSNTGKSHTKNGQEKEQEQVSKKKKKNKNKNKNKIKSST